MFKAYKYIVILKMHKTWFSRFYAVFPTLMSKRPKGRFVALRFIYSRQIIITESHANVT